MNHSRTILFGTMLVLFGLSCLSENLIGSHHKDKRNKKEMAKQREKLQDEQPKHSTSKSDIRDFFLRSKAKAQAREEEQKMKHLNRTRAAELIKPVFLTAVKEGDSDLVETLLEGNNVLFYVTDEEGMSALHLATQNNDVELVRRLFKANNTNIGEAYGDIVVGKTNDRGETPEDIALKSQNHELKTIFYEAARLWTEEEQKKTEIKKEIRNKLDRLRLLLNQ